MTDKELLELTAARDTLQKLGYTYEGGMLWCEPRVKPPRLLSLDVKLKLRDRIAHDLGLMMPNSISIWRDWPGTQSLAAKAVMCLERNINLWDSKDGT